MAEKMQLFLLLLPWLPEPLVRSLGRCGVDRQGEASSHEDPGSSPSLTKKTPELGKASIAIEMFTH